MEHAQLMEVARRYTDLLVKAWANVKVDRDAVISAYMSDFAAVDCADYDGCGRTCDTGDLCPCLPDAREPGAFLARHRIKWD
jgi:hypothetical protein